MKLQVPLILVLFVAVISRINENAFYNYYASKKDQQQQQQQNESHSSIKREVIPSPPRTVAPIDALPTAIDDDVSSEEEEEESSLVANDSWIEVENIVHKLEPIKRRTSESSTTNTTITPPPVVKVWMSSGPCGIVVAIREKEDASDTSTMEESPPPPPPPLSNGINGNGCPPSVSTSLNANKLFVGLHQMTQQQQNGTGTTRHHHTWKYRRAFGGCFDCTETTWKGRIITSMNNTRFACNHSTFAALSDLFALRPEACSQVSTVRAWWLYDNDNGKDKDDTTTTTTTTSVLRRTDYYALQLTPFTCQSHRCAPTISIFGGMDHCQQPLELMGEKELKEPVNDTMGCVYPTNADVRPLATVRVPDEIMLKFSSGVGLPGGGRWTQDGTRWEVLSADTYESPEPQQQQQQQPSQRQGDEVLLDNSKEKSSCHIPGLCLIGDSHFERNTKLIRTLTKNTLGLRYDGSTPQEKDVELRINFAVSGGFEAPARFNISVRQEIEHCYQWLQQSKQGGRGGGGAILLSLGSHQPRASLYNMTNFVRDLEDYLLQKAEHHQQQQQQPSNKKKHHVFVSSTLDSCHGNIPEHFYTELRLGQNTWREQAKAIAIQTAIEQSSLDNLHYIDLFSPSAALHFGHCTGGDPVHWSWGVFYEEHFRILFDAVHKTFCG